LLLFTLQTWAAFDNVALTNELEKLIVISSGLTNPTSLPRPINTIAYATITPPPPRQIVHLSHSVNMECAHL